MSSQAILLAHDLWRKGTGGAPAGLAGQADSFAYAGLDLGLAQFADSTFAGSSFTATSFRQASWTGCRFTGCHFAACDFDGIAITGCSFVGCTFSQARFPAGRLSGSSFQQCEWDDVDFDGGHWTDVLVRQCTGTRVRAHALQGQRVDFTGSFFEQLEFHGANIN